MKKLLLPALAALMLSASAADADFNPQRAGVSHTYPLEYKDWPDAFLAGNGWMGVMVFGNPLNETIIFNHRQFNLSNGTERSFATVSAADVQQIRDWCAAGNFAEANKLAVSSAQYKGGGDGQRHPGYGMFIGIPADGDVTDYSRVCDFRTGEIIVRWKDRRGQWERRTFVSRKDNVIVQFLTAPAGGRLDCDVQLDIREGMGLPRELKFTVSGDADTLNLRAKYKPNLDIGYEGVTRVVTVSGNATMSGSVLQIRGAKSALLLTRIAKYYGDFTAQCDKRELQAQLATLPADYDKLLQGQRDTHQKIYDRVKLDLGAADADRAKTNAELIAGQAASRSLSAAYLERIFDAGRYYFLSSSGDQSPPDLLGIWTGDCRAGWGGFYHLDANLNLQIGGGNIGAMPETMAGFFSIMESWRDGFRETAQKLLGCRGLVAAGNTPGIGKGLISGINDFYPYQYATGEAPWLLYPFWEHWLVTGDEKFLREKLYPLLVDMGEFYEDFLTKKDADGHYILAGSVSPEAQPPGLGVSLVNNSVFDISGAKFSLSALLETRKILGIPADAQSAKWAELLKNLPPYLINADGVLQEWAWPEFSSRGENFGHRHASHLLTVWPYREITPEADAKIFAAAAKAISKKAENRLGTGHGILHTALIGSGVKSAAITRAMLLRLVTWDFYLDSLCTTHNPKREVFCTDVAHTVPAIVMEMLVSSAPGELELLPALPWELERGSISGVKGRNRVTVENLSWDLAKKTVTLTLRSDIAQPLTLIERDGIAKLTVSGGVNVSQSPLGAIARVMQLPANVSISVTLALGTLRDADKPKVNLALDRPVTASSTDEGNKFFPQHLTDGDPGTRWASTNADSQWVYVDLGETKKISGVKLFWEKSAAKDYAIEVSDDAKKWTVIKSVADNDKDGSVEFANLNAQGRYVRINCRQRITQYGFSLWELEVYGE